MNDDAPVQVLAWIAGIAVTLALAALLWPAGARPMVSVLLGIALAAVALVAVRRVVRTLPHPERSDFQPSRADDDGELPADLQGLTTELRQLRSRRPIPGIAFWRLRRLAESRLRHRRGLDVRVEYDRAHVANVVSPLLYRLLIDDAAVVAGHDLPALITEVENL